MYLEERVKLLYYVTETQRRTIREAMETLERVNSSVAASRHLILSPINAVPGVVGVTADI